MKRASSQKRPPVQMSSVDVFNPSNSVEHAEIAMITNGFRPNFDKIEEGKFEQMPPRTLKTKRIGNKKKKRKGKRTLKRVCYNATSQQSSYSSLISEYHIESGNDLELNSNYVDEYEDAPADHQNGGNISPIKEESEENEEVKSNKSSKNEDNKSNENRDDKSLPEASSDNDPESSQNNNPESSSEKNNPSSGRESSDEESDSDSVPGDEDVDDSESYRNLSHNRPANNSQVFNQ